MASWLWNKRGFGLKMGWKNLSYWLRGGIVGWISGFLILLLPWINWSVYCSKLTNPLEVFNISGGGCDHISRLFWGGSSDVLFNFLALFVIFIITPAIITGLLGALIGYIYGKIKNRNKR